MKFAELLTDFKLRRAAIEKMYSEVEKGKIELDQWVMSTDMCKKWIEKSNELNKLKETYKADMKAKLGITDGERADILELISTMKKVSELE